MYMSYIHAIYTYFDSINCLFSITTIVFSLIDDYRPYDQTSNLQFSYLLSFLYCRAIAFKTEPKRIVWTISKTILKILIEHLCLEKK